MVPHREAGNSIGEVRRRDLEHLKCLNKCLKQQIQCPKVSNKSNSTTDLICLICGQRCLGDLDDPQAEALLRKDRAAILNLIDGFDMTNFTEDYRTHFVAIIGALFESVGGSVRDLQFHFHLRFDPYHNLTLCGSLLQVRGKAYLGSIPWQDLQSSLSASPVLDPDDSGLLSVRGFQWRCSFVLSNNEFDTEG